MEELEIFQKMSEIETPPFPLLLSDASEQVQRIAEHKVWLQNIRHERPSTEAPFHVGVYIRYFNQTRYSNYLDFHKKQFLDTLALCPRWTLVDFYVDDGSTAPNMESAPEWCRLLEDCESGKVNLIITQKVSNVSRKMREITICARLLAARKNPIGIYFISEDLYTLASYYRDDLRDVHFFPSPDWQILPDSDEEVRLLHD